LTQPRFLHPLNPTKTKKIIRNLKHEKISRKIININYNILSKILKRPKIINPRTGEEGGDQLYSK
jgi:hypothetical protein